MIGATLHVIVNSLSEHCLVHFFHYIAQQSLSTHRRVQEKVAFSFGAPTGVFNFVVVVAHIDYIV